MISSRKANQPGPIPTGGGATNALEEIAVTAGLLKELEARQRAAVLLALDNHSWAEIGTALGVSKQAAHRRFVKDLASEAQVHVAEIKAAGRSGNVADVLTEATALRATAALMRKRRVEGPNPATGTAG